MQAKFWGVLNGKEMLPSSRTKVIVHNKKLINKIEKQVINWNEEVQGDYENGLGVDNNQYIYSTL